MDERLLNVLTGINRPSVPSSGSMILAHDLYTAMPATRTTFLGRAPVDPGWEAAFGQLITLTTPKRSHGPDFARYQAELTREVGALINQAQPQAVHAQYVGFALSVAFARTAGSIPIISLAHGPEVMAAERSVLEREAMNEVAAASAAIVAPTRALADRIDRLTGHRYTDRLTVIPWGIPLHDIQVRERPSTGSGPLSVVHAGRLDDNKSTITAIDALAVAALPHQLTIIGTGSAEAALRARTRALGIQDRVTFAPFLPRQELWQRLPAYDAFVLTTSGTEAFCLMAIEAQAHGLPIVYSNLPGMEHTLGRAGAPFTPGSPASLASALDQLAHDAHWRRALARAALENAVRYDITTTRRQLHDLTLRATSLDARRPPPEMVKSRIQHPCEANQTKEKSS